MLQKGIQNKKVKIFKKQAEQKCLVHRVEYVTLLTGQKTHQEMPTICTEVANSTRFLSNLTSKVRASITLILTVVSSSVQD